MFCPASILKKPGLVTESITSLVAIVAYDEHRMLKE
jgi:hypothetical protein